MMMYIKLLFYPKIYEIDLDSLGKPVGYFKFIKTFHWQHVLYMFRSRHKCACKLSLGWLWCLVNTNKYKQKCFPWSNSCCIPVMGGQYWDPHTCIERSCVLKPCTGQQWLIANAVAHRAPLNFNIHNIGEIVWKNMEIVLLPHLQSQVWWHWKKTSGECRVTISPPSTQLISQQWPSPPFTAPISHPKTQYYKTYNIN